jgi:hypothetical protein
MYDLLSIGVILLLYNIFDHCYFTMHYFSVELISEVHQIRWHPHKLITETIFSYDVETAIHNKNTLDLTASVLMGLEVIFIL